MGLLSSLFSSKKENIRQEPLITPERRRALDLLASFAETGKIGDFQAGTPADLSGFDFGRTSAEIEGGSRLLDLIRQPDGSFGINKARDVLTGFSESEFDPDNPSSGLAAFKRQLARQIGDADDVIDREAAITGNRFGSRIIGEKGDLAARQSDIIASEVANQFERNEGRRFSAAGQLADLDRLDQQLQQSRIAQAFQIGGLERDLKNQQAQIKLNDFLRQRNERLNSISGLSTVAQTPIPFGVKNISSSTPSPFISLLSTTFGAFGKEAGQRGAEKIFDMFKDDD